MRIESIEIENFRQYRKEKFTFPHVKGKKDIHVIIGENGEGKTNILNALTWCLYGEELHLGDKNTALDNINSQYVDELRKRNEKNGYAKVTVVMSIEDGNQITFMRVAPYNITQSKITQHKHDVMVSYKENNEFKFSEKELDYAIQVSRYVPKEINEYIFFDGELMDQYFKTEQRGNIESGIKNLTKASVIEKTRNALLSYAKSEISPVLRSDGDEKVAAAQANLESFEKKYEDQQVRVSIIEEQIKKAKAEEARLTSIIHGLDNLKEKTDRLTYLEKESDELKENLRAYNKEMMEFVRQYYVYITLYPALKEFKNYIDKQESNGNLPPKIDKRLVESIHENKVCAVCGCKLDTEHLQHVLSILRKLEVSTATSAALNRASSALNSFFDKIKHYPKEKEKLIRSKKDLQLRVDKNDEEYKKLSDELRSIPNQSEITKAIEDRERYKESLERLYKKIGAEELRLKSFAKAVSNAVKDLENAMKNNSRLDLYRRQLDFCNKGAQLLKKVLDEVVKECREDMQIETFDIFNNMIWKENAFTKVNILDDYSFELLDAYGQQTLGACSAAERALLALAFTIALQQTSGHDSLLYIDTPLGRVGEKNRINFMKVLTGIGDSKQVILSFTPTEYDVNVQEQLTNQYSSFCELNFKDGITTIKH